MESLVVSLVINWSRENFLWKGSKGLYISSRRLRRERLPKMYVTDSIFERLCDRKRRKWAQRKSINNERDNPRGENEISMYPWSKYGRPCNWIQKQGFYWKYGSKFWLDLDTFIWCDKRLETNFPSEVEEDDLRLVGIKHFRHRMLRFKRCDVHRFAK